MSCSSRVAALFPMPVSQCTHICPSTWLAQIVISPTFMRAARRSMLEVIRLDDIHGIAETEADLRPDDGVFFLSVFPCID
eukprot:scaffold631099_cov39-Prasinocladus_malaysianus.AAC.2